MQVRDRLEFCQISLLVLQLLRYMLLLLLILQDFSEGYQIHLVISGQQKLTHPNVMMSEKGRYKTLEV
jgi:cell division inhibitor SulA